MATAYVGVRQILAGRNTNNWRNTYTNKVGVYSNWSLMSSDPAVLAGVPDRERVLGTDGILRKPRFLELIYTGKQPLSPLDAPGLGARQADGRFRPLEYKGIVSAFPSGYGHALRNTTYSVYTNLVYDGLVGLEALLNAGHAQRYGLSYGGPFKPLIYQGITTPALDAAGHAVRTDHYGYPAINEWKGVPSSKVL